MKSNNLCHVLIRNKCFFFLFLIILLLVNLYDFNDTISTTYIPLLAGVDCFSIVGHLAAAKK